jgi:hypothetical protein
MVAGVFDDKLKPPQSADVKKVLGKTFVLRQKVL